YLPVLRGLPLAIHRCFAGGIGYPPVLHRLAPAIHLWFIVWHRLFTSGSQVGTAY
ncbi:hypothetical protein HAX54_019229, partial [Datura stramonium]|nr:hypothetical protein [Datura stramonium]